MLKHLLFFTLLAFIFFSCKNKNEDFIRIDTYDKQVIEYFQEIAFGFNPGDEGDVTHKWQEDVKIFIGGQPSTVNFTEIEEIRDEVNQLATDGFSIEIVTDSIQSNFYVYIGTAAQYSKIFPTFTERVENSWVLFNVYWNSENDLRLALVFMDNEKTPISAQPHYLRSMISRSMGLTNTSYQYYQSIFYNTWNPENTDYTQIDRDIIRLMYHPSMSSGLEKGEELNNILLTILINEK